MGISTKNQESSFELERFIPFRLNQAAEKISLDFARVYKNEYGMTRPEWRTLANLGRHGQMTAREICTLSIQHKTKVSRAVCLLEKRGWLKRSTNPNDRREEWLVLTSKGRSVYHKLAEMGTKREHQLKEALGPENSQALEQALDALMKCTLR